MPDNHFLIAMPNAIVPYGYEMIPILAYPNGFSFRFRFEEAYVAEGVRPLINNLEDQKGYIVLRDKVTAKLYPIRFFKITKASKVGDIYHFVFTLGDLLKLDSNESVRREQIEKFNKDIKKFHKFSVDDIPGNNLKPLVFFSNYDPKLTNQSFQSTDTLERELEQWGNVIAGISEINFFRNVQFLRIRKVIAIDSNGTSYFKDGVLNLKAGSDYEMDIVQRIINPTGEDISSGDVKLDSDNNVLSMLRGSLKAVGRYDILKFRFHVRSQSSKKKSFLDILHIPKSGENRIEPRLGMQLQILSNNRFPWAKFILSVVLVFAFLIPSILSWVPFLSEEQTNDIAVASFAISTVFLIIDLKNYLK
ncbi:MAG TPA: hypothetical protein VKA31_06965 [Mariprofundaceae bacterium]|nr:hypothetical protein [Mariprofundaceae bacterium]